MNVTFDIRILLNRGSPSHHYVKIIIMHYTGRFHLSKHSLHVLMNCLFCVSVFRFFALVFLWWESNFTVYRMQHYMNWKNKITRNRLNSRLFRLLFGFFSFVVLPSRSLYLLAAQWVAVCFVSFFWCSGGFFLLIIVFGSLIIIQYQLQFGYESLAMNAFISVSGCVSYELHRLIDDGV